MGRTLRILSFWAVLIVGSIALVQLASSRHQAAANISYTQFTEQLDAGNVAAVEIAQRELTGDFKHAGSEAGTARSCPTCHGSGYVRVIPGPDGQPRRCQHAGSKDNDPRHCPTCQGAGWAGLVAG